MTKLVEMTLEESLQIRMSNQEKEDYITKIEKY